MFDRSPIRQQAFSYYSRLQRVKAYVDENLPAAISLRAAADQAGLEERDFSSYFRAKTGICFSRWLTHRRIQEAQQMLQRHDYTITEVAFAVGYQDLTTFERAFKRCTEMTPREFKAAARPR